jgi:hypothetical protein
VRSGKLGQVVDRNSIGGISAQGLDELSSGRHVITSIERQVSLQHPRWVEGSLLLQQFVEVLY